eukprot:6185041-Pyramimonas_sp.AAC.1
MFHVRCPSVGHLEPLVDAVPARQEWLGRLRDSGGGGHATLVKPHIPAPTMPAETKLNSLLHRSGSCCCCTVS